MSSRSLFFIDAHSSDSGSELESGACSERRAVSGGARFTCLAVSAALAVLALVGPVRTGVAWRLTSQPTVYDEEAPPAGSAHPHHHKHLNNEANTVTDPASSGETIKTTTTTSKSSSTTESTNRTTTHANPTTTSVGVKCGLQKQGINVETVQPVVFALEDVSSAEDCSLECQHRAECTVWTWVKAKGLPDSNTCLLKALVGAEVPKWVNNASVVSGSIPCSGPVGWVDGAKEDKLVARAMSHYLPCDLMEKDVHFDTRSPTFETIHGVESQKDCSFVCFERHWCQAWSWNSETDACHLKALLQAEIVEKKRRPGMWSGGLPCHPKHPAVTIFCFALMRPDSYEHGLLARQYHAKAHLFTCNDFVIYSNEVIEVVPGIKTEVVDVSLKCHKGGRDGTFLNTHIFVEVWKQVIRSQRYLLQDWTLKVDPDAVIFPDVVRTLLAHHPESPQGVYIQNCRFGVYGAVEAFSRNAVTAWSEGMSKCKEYMKKRHIVVGEDMYIDTCLDKVLHARRDTEWGLLTDRNCSSPDLKFIWTPARCVDGRAAFHPFKDPDDHFRCMEFASRAQLTKAISV